MADNRSSGCQLFAKTRARILATAVSWRRQMLPQDPPEVLRDLMAYEANLQARLRETAHRQQAEQQFAMRRRLRRLRRLRASEAG